MEFGPGSKGRLLFALLVLAALGGLAAVTMEPGRLQTLVWVLLGFFAFRMLLYAAASR